MMHGQTQIKYTLKFNYTHKVKSIIN